VSRRVLAVGWLVTALISVSHQVSRDRTRIRIGPPPLGLDRDRDRARI